MEINVINEFKAVWAGRVSNDSRSFTAVGNLSQIYNIGRCSVRLLAHLLNVRPGGLMCDRVAEILKTDDFCADKTLQELKDKGFICEKIVNRDVPFVKLTDEAFEAFSEDRLLWDRDRDCIAALRDDDECHIFEDFWIRALEAAVRHNPDRQFSKGWLEIGADKLGMEEKKTLCAALRHFIKNFTERFKPERIMTVDDMQPSNLLEPDKDTVGNVNFPYSANDSMNSLLEKGLLENDNGSFVITKEVAGALLHGADSIVSYKTISRRATVIKPSSITKKELFFTEESQEEIDHLRTLLSPEGFGHACAVLRRQKRNPAIQSLLWGGPGTGKTETVKQLALESGRDIFQFDVAKVTASLWGDTENLYRELFLEYQYIVAVKSLTPILFINEADHVLGRRLTNLDRSIDKSENTVSDILLEEFENMHGILFATTNFKDVLDEAFDRRFLFKTELRKPDRKAQAKIWKSNIPELSVSECKHLAETYDMSGAQISNVTTTRDLAELYYKGDRGLAYIEMLCRKETKSDKMAELQKPARIGFGR